MRPMTHLRRAPTVVAAVMLPALIADGLVSAGTEPAPPADTIVESTAGPAPSTAVDGTDTTLLDIPGGEIPDVLTEGTWFDDEGRLYFPEATSQTAEKDAAFCSFVFGTPEEVADSLELDDLAWAADSGLVNLGGGGTGYSCGLVPADSEDVLVTSPADTSSGTTATAADSFPTTDDAEDSATGDSDTGDSDAGDSDTSDSDTDEVRPLVVFVLLSEPLEVDGMPEGYSDFFQLDGGDGLHHGALALSTDYDGRPLDAELAEAWLTAARDRLA